ncbi:Fatty acyl-CoA reductase 1, partial [Camponotus floridanus]
IVISSLKDPIPGWIDNFNGPIGLCIFCGKGLFRVFYGSNCTSQNDIPIDTVINTIILVTWKLGLTTFIPKSTLVINCTFPDEKSMLFQEVINIMLKLLKKIPLEGIVWIPSAVLTKSLIIYYVLTILWHILPAIIIDSVLKFSGHQPMVHHFDNMCQSQGYPR